MDFYIIMVFICLVLSLTIIFTKAKFQGKLLKIVFKLCLFVGILKYISLLIFHSTVSPKFLYNLRFLPLLSLITLFILGYLIIYFVLEKPFKPLQWGVLLVVVALGTYIIYSLPFGINNSSLGYVLIKNTKWIFVESLYIILICVAFIAIALKTFVNTKDLKHKISYIIISVSFIGVLVEEIMAIMDKTLFHFNIVGDLSVLTMILTVVIINSNFKIKAKA